MWFGVVIALTVIVTYSCIFFSFADWEGSVPVKNSAVIAGCAESGEALYLRGSLRLCYSAVRTNRLQAFLLLKV